MDAAYFEKRFLGLIGEDYNKIHCLVNPNGPQMSALIGIKIAEYQQTSGRQECCAMEIGCGTGLSTYVLLATTKNVRFTALDSEPAMLEQAKGVLEEWKNSNRVKLVKDDALNALRNIEDNCIDVVCSVYAIHNFFNDYRTEFLNEVHRVLVPGGIFLNGDRYALDDPWENTQLIKKEIGNWFEKLVSDNRLDLLKTWVLHVCEDESAAKQMQERKATALLKEIGFSNVQVLFREGVDAVIFASKSK